MTKAEEMAAKLTEAQRNMLNLHRPTYGDRERGWPGSALRDAHSFAQAGKPMMEAGLISWTENPRSSQTIITPLGRKVREARSDETPAADQPVGQEPGPQGDAQPSGALTNQEPTP